MKKAWAKPEKPRQSSFGLLLFLFNYGVAEKKAAGVNVSGFTDAPAAELQKAISERPCRTPHPQPKHRIEPL
jgi:hypothetical protein